ncbi:DNA starvation/stationary phase protection protein [Paenibacillus albicereus]|uniref:DNA starvation/stationary phase protection protein n=1 Tax=Paenibacillus albicereus TaxID=2726185 RepID=A0A6H2H324_9BACL|nr:DNA starvation/stationary phase protection protein [Paenibacillus albicereus]QJC53816.1 DNA starvation/stationary phase protection protein [Paenibacillus albicereus]
MATSSASRTAKGTAKTQEGLNKQVATLGVLYMKLHSFHWNVTGPNFYTLHVKFEELYNAVTLMFDEAAERLIAIGGKPVSTMKGMLSLSSIKEATEKEDADAMVRAVIDDFGTIASEMKEAAEAAEQEDDAATADILTGMVEQLDKHRWMLEKFLG